MRTILSCLSLTPRRTSPFSLLDSPLTTKVSRSNCLGHFISVVCESDNVSLLSRCSFVGLQSELERNLAFRARNADPFSSPNYYAVFYSYLIANGDFRSGESCVHVCNGIGLTWE